MARRGRCPPPVQHRRPLQQARRPPPQAHRSSWRGQLHRHGPAPRTAVVRRARPGSCSARCRPLSRHRPRPAPGRPGSANSAMPMMAPTSGSRFRKAPATSADTRLWPNANSEVGSTVPASTSPMVASSAGMLTGPAAWCSVSERDRQHGDSRRHQLKSGDRDRVAAAQQPGLRDREASRDQLSGQHQPVAAQA